MNPQTPNQNQDDAPFGAPATPSDTPNPTTPALESTPEADEAALQAIEALEAEENPVTPQPSDQTSTEESIPVTVNSTPSKPQAAPVEASTSTPFSAFGASTLGADDTASPLATPSSSPNEQPAPSESPVVAAALASSLKDEATPQQSDPFGPKKKSKKGLIIAVILVLVLAGGSVAGYFVWQSLSGTQTTDTTETETGGDLPSGPEIDLETAPTPESVESEASSIESDLNSIDNSELEDTTLNDATLYQN